MCGKDGVMTRTEMLSMGSPPHVRERLQAVFVMVLLFGITPACAGKTQDFRIADHRREDHPRMCGKDPADAAGLSAKAGSPPHVRERRPAVDEKTTDMRITPACAGKTVMDPFIFALLRLPTFKIYLISLLNI